MRREKKQSIVAMLFLLVLLLIGVYLTYQTHGNWRFALELRGKKLIAFIIVGIGTSFATITFQTMTHNHFLTPNILGFDSLYVFIQTILFYFASSKMGDIFKNELLLFGVNVVLMVSVSTVTFYFLLRRESQDLYLLLMIGMVLGTFFKSGSTFLQVLMDPNEYDKLQGKLFASFGNVDVHLLKITGMLVIFLILYLWIVAKKLDVLHLGTEPAINLGIDIHQFHFILLIVISSLIALSTSLVGPVTFLGFIVANIAYQLMQTYQHRYLFLAASLISILMLVLGQFLVEQVFHMNTTISIIIEFVGGLYFVGKILSRRKEGAIK